MGLVLEAATKAAVYAALMLAAGACVTHWLLCPRRGSVRTESVERLHRRLARFESQAAVFLIAAVASRVPAHTVSVFGLTDAVSWPRLSIVAFESRWGNGWRLQAIGAAVIVIVARWTRNHRRGGWAVVSVASLGMCYLLPLTGHAAGSPMRVLVHGSHVLGASVWLGTLATVFVLRRFEGRLQETDHSMAHAPLTASMLQRFAPVALSGAFLVTAPGLALAWLYIGSLGNLLATVYGRALTFKLAAFSVVAGCGFLNWRRLHRGSNGQFASRHSRVITVELVFAAAVIAITGVVTELAHP